MKSDRLALLLLSQLLSLAGAGGAKAACSACTCTTTVADIAFGTYDASSPTARDSVGGVTVRCSSAMMINGYVDITLSTGSSGTYAGRQMSKGSDRLNYNVYADAARTQVWGNGAGGTYLMRASASGVFSFTATAPAYGRIAAGQWTPAGTYGDTLVVTITY